MANNYTELFKHYISLTREYELPEALEHSTQWARDVFARIDHSKLGFRYQPGKWTVAQVLSHIIDAERVFAYRAMRFSRQDTTPLASFDDDHYALRSGFENRNLESFLEEFFAQRVSTVMLFNSFTPEMLTYSDNEIGKGLTVEKLGRMIAGHSMHHCNILVERYDI